MRIRWIIVAGAIGLLIAWHFENLVAAYVAVFGCLILLGLRSISLKLDEGVDVDDDLGPSRW
ncbi:MAG: hypothetical protein JWP25_6608 [Bradyrhizobium sp.]|nr:hypothetical protein [Bradyrhizobium sp.]